MNRTGEVNDLLRKNGYPKGCHWHPHIDGFLTTSDIELDCLEDKLGLVGLLESLNLILDVSFDIPTTRLVCFCVTLVKSFWIHGRCSLALYE